MPSVHAHIAQYSTVSVLYRRVHVTARWMEEKASKRCAVVMTLQHLISDLKRRVNRRAVSPKESVRNKMRAKRWTA
jgi:hypothetical protein